MEQGKGEGEERTIFQLREEDVEGGGSQIERIKRRGNGHRFAWKRERQGKFH